MFESDLTARLQTVPHRGDLSPGEPSGRVKLPDEAKAARRKIQSLSGHPKTNMHSCNRDAIAHPSASERRRSTRHQKPPRRVTQPPCVFSANNPPAVLNSCCENHAERLPDAPQRPRHSSGSHVAGGTCCRDIEARSERQACRSPAAASPPLQCRFTPIAQTSSTNFRLGPEFDQLADSGKELRGLPKQRTPTVPFPHRTPPPPHPPGKHMVTQARLLSGLIHWQFPSTATDTEQERRSVRED
ncbi:hypothetical protein AAFF_G00020320 [Aldrovandia affinis]|uniref:Uncharacterized protein n=1 Tax=Aldrovandia affinis TaxID=143900 RepID=A0AAD7WGW1_9TELE|nr:hypothetical protein AAFF_G00020320 [Aldrovandia affinis]